MRCTIDWAILIAGSKCTIFALFYFVFEGNFPSKSLQGTYLEGRFNGGFFAFGGRIFREAPTWRGLFSEFYRNIKLYLACLHNNKPLTLSVCDTLKRFSYDLEKWFR